LITYVNKGTGVRS